jgi:hypothetical protein
MTHYEQPTWQEDEGDIRPVYEGVNAPQFGDLDTAPPHLEAYDSVTASDELPTQVETDEQQTLETEWQAMVEAQATLAAAERQRRERLLKAAPSQAEQLRNARRAERRHRSLVPKQIYDRR